MALAPASSFSWARSCPTTTTMRSFLLSRSIAYRYPSSASSTAHHHVVVVLRRGYAHKATTTNHSRDDDDSDSDSEADHHLSWPRSAHPSPYEVLGLHRNAPYTKRRFYQLVKLYHPDMPRPADTTTPPPPRLTSAVRLERYRLVVAAHGLLSDPQKRHLYDRHGIGWVSSPPPPPQQHHPDHYYHPHHHARDMDRSWRYQPGNASRNATWEDWEQWRAAASGKTSGQPTYMSNGTFAALVVCMCMIGAFAQMERAEAAGEQYVDFVQQKDWAIGQKMRESTIASSGRTKDERVDSFLRDRENLTFDFQPAKFDAPPSPPSNRPT